MDSQVSGSDHHRISGKLVNEDIYNQFNHDKPLEHIKYSCDVPGWFTDKMNDLIDVVNDLQTRVGHGNGR